MYLNKLTVALKHNGKILRERSGYISLPFGSEYSLLIKNLNTRKASVKISIDGEDILNNKSLLVYPNSYPNTEIELKGFMDGMTARNRFKFIQKTKEISDYRGDRIDDGLIRIEFAFEKEKPEIVHHHHRHHHDDDWYWPRRPWSPCRYRGGMWSSSVKCSFNSSNDTTDVMESSTLYSNDSFNDDGITVKGSEINQDFNYGSIDELERSHVMIIKLRGEKNNGTIIRKPITVKTRLVCPTCGKKSRSDLKYCSTCGTFLN